MVQDCYDINKGDIRHDVGYNQRYTILIEVE